MVITCSEDKTVRVWTLTTGKQILCYKGHKEIPTCCDVYGNTVASADVSYFPFVLKILFTISRSTGCTFGI